MKTVITLAIAAIFVGLGAVAFAYSGLYDVSARTAHSGPVQWLLSKTSRAAIQRRAASIEVPDLATEALALAGVSDYEAMCAGCHGAPGKEPTALAMGLNPPAPDLSRSAQSMSPAELYWVTKHGIKMTGMPAWGVSHDDAALWPVVAFMTRLPMLDDIAYRAYLDAATGKGHHQGETGNDGNDHAEPGANHDVEHDPAPDADSTTRESDLPADHHDGHDHEH